MMIIFWVRLNEAIEEDGRTLKLEYLEWLGRNVRGGIRGYWMVPGTWPGDPFGEEPTA